MSPDHHHNEVHIIIDKTPKDSPNPTTGAALYVLGQVKPGFDLFREVHGKGDDELIPNSAASIGLKEGDHFYTAQQSLNPGGNAHQ